MAAYLLQVAYTAEAWKTLIANPQDRAQALAPVLQKLGGSFSQTWFCFGEYDLIAVMEMPDNVSAAAFSLAATSGGAVRAIKTTPLLSTAEGIEAMKRAQTSGYQPPRAAGA